jgi:hypothetical protein
MSNVDLGNVSMWELRRKYIDMLCEVESIYFVFGRLSGAYVIGQNLLEYEDREYLTKEIVKMRERKSK